jgi:hypothetical protein
LFRVLRPAVVCGIKHFITPNWRHLVRRDQANITPVSKMIGGTATVTPQRMVRIAFHVNRVEHYPQTQRGLPAHAIGHVMVGITAQTEHRVRRLKRAIIPPLAITPAPHVQVVRQTVHTLVPAVQLIHALGHVMVGITAQTEHHVPRLKRDIIPRRDPTHAPHARTNQATVHTRVPAVQQIHALGHVMVGITARMEHRVPRWKPGTIPRRDPTHAARAPTVWRTVHTLVPAVRPIHVHTPVTTVITNNLRRT